MKVYVTCKLYHAEEYIIEHYLNYYREMGVDGFLFNFSYYFEGHKEGFQEFVDRLTSANDDITFNVGPHCISDGAATARLKELVKESDADYIIPTDADEFVVYDAGSLQDAIKLLEDESAHVIEGCTTEHVSKTGEVTELVPDISIWEQFPNVNPVLPIAPKIGLVRADCFHLTGCGHHQMSKEHGLKSFYASRSHHFRWTAQGKSRAEDWVEIWSNPEYGGYKHLEGAKGRVKIFSMNLLEYGKG
jgi:hypothetical protein